MACLRFALGAVLCAALLAACSGSGESESLAADPDAVALPALETASPGPTAATELPTPKPTDAAEVGANELGEIPVLMYHRLLPDGGGEYDRTPDEFRAELQQLYDEGYRPVRTIDLVRGELDVAAGMTPVVLTFDDSTREQFAYAEDASIQPDTAVGILLAFAEAHPDFPAVGSFYVNTEPFGGGPDSAALLADIHELGFELGNHTAGHVNMGQSDADTVRRELAAGVEVITDAVPDAEVRTMALPLGVWSEPRDLVYSGSWEGTEYVNEGILLVGSDPAPSPFHAEFDPHAIPRIRTAPIPTGEPDYGSGFWLDILARNPDRRYRSDGNPSWVSFPSALSDQLDEAFADRANPY